VLIDSRIIVDVGLMQSHRRRTSRPDTWSTRWLDLRCRIKATRTHPLRNMTAGEIGSAAGFLVATAGPSRTLTTKRITATRRRTPTIGIGQKKRRASLLDH
jgi:hypothetical protein